MQQKAGSARPRAALGLALGLLAAWGIACPRHVPAPKALPPQTQKRIDHVRWRALPWVRPKGQERLLRQHIFQIEEDALRRGQPIPSPPVPDWQDPKAVALLSVSVSCPAKIPCGRAPGIEVTLANRTPRTLRLAGDAGRFEVEVVAADGQLVKPRPPPVVAAIEAGRHALPPRPPVYAEFPPDEPRTYRLRTWSVWRILPPGRYHVRVRPAFKLHPRDAQALGIRQAHAAIQCPAVLKAIDLEPSSEVNGLACRLEADKEQIAEGEPFTLKVELQSRSDRSMLRFHRFRLAAQLAAGSFLFRSPTTGRSKRLVWSHYPAAVDDGYSPWWPREGDYLEIKPGRKLEMTFTIDADRWKQLAGILVPGGECEVTWHYANYDHWYLKDGYVQFHSTVWTGHLISAPVRIQVAPARDAASRPRPRPP